MNGLWTPGRVSAEVEAAGSRAPLIPALGSNLPTPHVLAAADGRLEIDTTERMVIADGEPIDIAPKEFDVLTVLAERVDRLVTHEDISQRVWDDATFHSASRSPTTTMGHLRKKLGEELGDKEHGAIRIYQGLGYFAVSSLEHSSKRPKRMEESPAYLVADNRIKVDTENQLVVCDGEILEEITPRLFVILACLANEPEKVATLEKLGMAAWGSFDRHRANGVRVGVSQLRKNFGPELGNISTGAIRTRFEAGYYAVEVLDS